MPTSFLLSIPHFSGPSSIPGYLNRYFVESFSQDFDQTVSISQSGGAGAGKVTFNTLSLTLTNDPSLALLFEYLCSGSPLSSKATPMILVAVDVSGDRAVRFQQYTFGISALKSINYSSDYMSLTVLIEVGQFNIKTWPISQNGATPPNFVEAGWDRVANKSWHIPL